MSLLILVLSTSECSDTLFFENQIQSKIDVNHEHEEENHDTCPITCICSCCGMTIAFQEVLLLNLNITTEEPSSLVASYLSIYNFDSLFNIWQPPKNIS
ncbi:hypothetical protein SAMN04489761_0920 [Tenacibaculum sp. MAR_2009_124]|nr:hypothetical protein SAMN04489761_0920 [Tenacibaculum sp. MAR_2009_124]